MRNSIERQTYFSRRFLPFKSNLAKSLTLRYYIGPIIRNKDLLSCAGYGCRETNLSYTYFKFVLISIKKAISIAKKTTFSSGA
jgi:hypothetical protein